MNFDQRAELLRLLETISRECPQFRFGQLVANLTTLGSPPDRDSIWDVEDEELIAGAKQLLEDYRKSAVSAA